MFWVALIVSAVAILCKEGIAWRTETVLSLVQLHDIFTAY